MRPSLNGPTPSGCGYPGADELGEDAVLTFTREPPDGWAGHTGRIDGPMIAGAPMSMATAFLCGSNAFVEAASRLLLDAGTDPARIRTERFGPTGVAP